MKALLTLTVLMLASFSAQADQGVCASTQPAFEMVCSQQFTKDTCNAQIGVCQWLEMEYLGNSGGNSASVVIEE